MEKFFVPYIEGSPVALEIKGHRLMLVGTDQDLLLNDLELIGGDTIRELSLPEGDQAQLAALAASVHGGVVVAPAGMPLLEVLVDLEVELPWVH